MPGLFTAATDEIPPECRQIVRVLAEGWNSSAGRLQRFERANSNEPWSPIGESVSVLLGRNGMGCADGVQQIPVGAEPRKTEGDGRSPAGMFRLKSVFWQKPIEAVHMPSIQIGVTTEAVDDPSSRFYNQIVDRNEVAKPDWRSSERMAKIAAYVVGVVVEANPSRRPEGGSCIFIHLWRNRLAATSGCTALREKDLLDLIHWLRANRNPLLIQLPEEAARSLPSGLSTGE